MSVRIEKEGKVHVFRTGDAIQIGIFEGTIVEFDADGRRAIVATPSGRVEVRLGENLGQARPLTDEASEELL